MKSREVHVYILLFFILFYTSCTQEASDDFIVIQTESKLDQYAIEIHNNQIIMLGGDSWKQCDLSTSNNGKTWATEYFTNRALFDLHTRGSNIYAVGTSGYLFSGEDSLLKQQVPITSQLRAITSVNEDIITIAGKDFNKGWVYSINQSYDIIKEHFFNHELSDVKCDKDSDCIAVGYGIILTSTDQGLNWERVNQTGDFYKSLDFNSKGTPYTVGYAGSILYSSDKGTSWKSLQSGHSPLHKNPPFRKIKFYNETGYIVGDNGTIWKSKNDGSSWEDISINTDLDLFDFVLFNDELVIAAKTGAVLIIDK